MVKNKHFSIAPMLTRYVIIFLIPASGMVMGSCSGVTAPNTKVSSSTGQVKSEDWPGKNDVVPGDNLNQFTDNLSGLFYEPAYGGGPAVLWAALNGPGNLYRLVFNGEIWTNDTANEWGAGKKLRYPDGTGSPDAESVTSAELNTPFLYIATERDNNANSISRLSILRFDTSTSGTELIATHEWNLTENLPKVGANLGLEAITWIPDSYLKGLLDDRGVAYEPAHHRHHGTGLFVVGLEGTGTLYAYALDHNDGTFDKIATFTSGQNQVMGLEFDRDTGALWAACDNNCKGTQSVLSILGGKFVVRRIFDRPSTLPDSNHEGIAIAPESECSGGFKRFFWSDDDSKFDGHALRIGSIPCGPLF